MPAVSLAKVLNTKLESDATVNTTEVLEAQLFITVFAISVDAPIVTLYWQKFILPNPLDTSEILNVAVTVREDCTPVGAVIVTLGLSLSAVVKVRLAAPRPTILLVFTKSQFQLNVSYSVTLVKIVVFWVLASARFLNVSFSMSLLEFQIKKVTLSILPPSWDALHVKFNLKFSLSVMPVGGYSNKAVIINLLPIANVSKNNCSIAATVW